MPQVQTMADSKSVPLPTDGVEPVEIEIKEKSQANVVNTEEMTSILTVKYHLN